MGREIKLTYFHAFSIQGMVVVIICMFRYYFNLITRKPCGLWYRVQVHKMMYNEAPRTLITVSITAEQLIFHLCWRLLHLFPRFRVCDGPPMHNKKTAFDPYQEIGCYYIGNESSLKTSVSCSVFVSFYLASSTHSLRADLSLLLNTLWG